MPDPAQKPDFEPVRNPSRPLNYLSLFSGIGGLDLGLDRAGMTCVGQVEIDPFCRRVLAKHWPDVPRHDDVRTATEWWLSKERPKVDVVCGGFPCQDISVAGKRAGIIDGERSRLWTYLADCIRVLRPSYAVLENVSRLVVRGLDVVAADLAAIGYDLRWDCVPAAAVGAPHLRDRWFGIAHPQRQQLRVEPVGESGGQREAVIGLDGSSRDVADWEAVWPQALANAEGERRRAPGQVGAEQAGTDLVAGPAGQRAGDNPWATEPNVGRVAHGVPSRLDRAVENERIRALGNAVVPQVAEHIGRIVQAIESKSPRGALLEVAFP